MFYFQDIYQKLTAFGKSKDHDTLAMTFVAFIGPGEHERKTWFFKLKPPFAPFDILTHCNLMFDKATSLEGKPKHVFIQLIEGMAMIINTASFNNTRILI